MSIVTIQTQINKCVENKIGLEYLQQYGELFGRATRTAFAMRNRIGKTDKKDSELEKFICKELESKFGLSNSEAKNVYSKASALYSSQSELVELHIEENLARIKGIYQALKKLEFQLNKAIASEQIARVKKIKKKIHFKQQKINKLQAKIVRLKESKASGKFSVTFGSAKIFEKQYRLEKNGYSSHNEWLEDWRGQRSARSFFVGSKNFGAGNQLVRYSSQNNTLTLTVSPSLRPKYGDSVSLHKISFARGQEWLQAAVEPVRYTSTRKGKNGLKVITSRRRIIK